jgi:hypothetical protein
MSLQRRAFYHPAISPAAGQCGPTLSGTIPRMSRTELRYRWRYIDQIRKKHWTTRHHATREEIEREHPDAVAVPGTKQILELAKDGLSNSMARFQQGLLK